MQPTDDIIKLTPYRHVRLRTEMYYGSRAPHYQTVINWTGNKLEPLEVTWTPAVYTFLREVIDNSLDEVIAHGYGDTIDITYNSKTFEFSVADNGRGIPIDWDENEKMHKATLVLSQIMAGRNFDSRGESAGLNGIGASGVNFCSEYFNVIIQRDNKRFEQMFHEGTEMFDELDIREPVITKGGNKSGTYIKFKLSKTVFKNPKLPIEFVKARIFEIAASYPKIKFNFNGQLLKVKPTVEKTLFANNDVIIIDINNPNFKSKYYIVPNFANEGEYVHTLVNRIPAFNGGQHIDTFKKLFYSGLLSSLERESKKRGLQPNKSDISEGLLIYNITTMLNPNFDSQSKTRLINDEVDVYIKDVLNNENTFKNIIKHNKEWIDSIYKRCSDRTQRKDEVEIAKLSRKLMRTKVPKLLDANGKDRTKCIIFICEGDCLGEDTEIAIFENGKFINKKIKDVEINDLVMTHTGSIKPIEYKQAKIVDGLQITTSTNKKVIVGYEHKLLVFNKNTQKYDFIKAKYIDKTIHYLIKSLININAGFIYIRFKRNQV
jgi:DNA gyrase/topoisomerase IV subunit B